MVEVLQSRFTGVMAGHGEFSAMQVWVDRGEEGSWVRSVGHDEVVGMTDLRGV